MSWRCVLILVLTHYIRLARSQTESNVVANEEGKARVDEAEVGVDEAESRDGGTYSFENLYYYASVDAVSKVNNTDDANTPTFNLLDDKVFTYSLAAMVILIIGLVIREIVKVNKRVSQMDNFHGDDEDSQTTDSELGEILKKELIHGGVYQPQSVTSLPQGPARSMPDGVSIRPNGNEGTASPLDLKANDPLPLTDQPSPSPGLANPLPGTGPSPGLANPVPGTGQGSISPGLANPLPGTGPSPGLANPVSGTGQGSPSPGLANPLPGTGPSPGLANPLPGTGPSPGLANPLPGTGPSPGLANPLPGTGPSQGLANPLPGTGPSPGLANPLAGTDQRSPSPWLGNNYNMESTNQAPSPSPSVTSQFLASPPPNSIAKAHYPIKASPRPGSIAPSTKSGKKQNRKLKATLSTDSHPHKRRPIKKRVSSVNPQRSKTTRLGRSKSRNSNRDNVK